MAVDFSAATVTPPPTRKGGRPRAQAQTVTTKRHEREEGLNGLFQVVSAGLLMARQPADAAAVAEHGPNISREAAILADQNGNVAKALDYITAVGPFAALLGAAMPLVLQILANHGTIPAAALAPMGVKDPKALQAQYEADALREYLAAQAEQQQALEQLAEVQREAQARALAQQNGKSSPTDVRLPQP